MSLIVKIGVDIRKFDKEMKKLTRDVTTVSSKLKNIGKTMTTHVTAPLAGVALVASKTGMEFEASMSQVAATLGTTSDKIGNLTDLAKEMGKTTKFTASQAAEGINFMALSGWKAEDIFKGLPAVLNLAAAGSLELGEASDMVTDVITAMGKSADYATKLTDIFAKTSSNANTTVGQMGNAMVLVAGQANTLGIDTEDLAQAIGLMANAGFKGEIAGQHLSAGIRRMVAPSNKAAKAMKQYGIAIVQNEDGSLDFGATMGVLRDKLSGLTKIQKAQALGAIFGADAQKSWAAIVNASSDDYATLEDAIMNSDGAAAQMAKTMNDNLKGDILTMKSALEGLAIDLYDLLKPALETIVNTVTKMARAFANLSPKTKELIFGIAAVAGSIGPLILAASALIKMFGFVKAAMSVIGIASMGMMAVWILVALAVAALVIAIIVYWDEIKAVTIKVWTTIKDFMVNLWNSTVEIAKSVWGSISSFFSELWNGIKEVTMTVWNGIKDFFSEWGLTILAVITGPIGMLIGLIVTYWDEISAFTTQLWNSIKDFLVGVWNSIVSAVSPIFSTLGTFFSGIWNGIKSVVTAVWDFITQYLKAIWTAFLYFATPLFNSLATYLKGVWDSIKNVTQTVWNSIKTFLTTVMNAIKSFFTTVWNSIKSKLTTIFNSIKSVATTVFNSIKSVLTTIMNSIKSVMTSVWNSIKSTLTSVWNTIKSSASSAWNAIKSKIETPVNSVKSKVTSAFTSMKSSISSIFNSIKSLASSIWGSISTTIKGMVTGLSSGVVGAFNGMKTSIMGVWNGIKSGMKTVINSIISMVNKFIGGFNAPAKALNKLPGVSAPTISKIPMLATGGTIFGSGQAIVGEAGPELVSKSGSSVKVTPLSAGEKSGGIGGALGGGTGGTIEVPVNLDGRTIARVVAPLMDGELRGRRDSKSRSRGGY